MARSGDSVLVGTHLYREDYDRFKDLCRARSRYHAEVIRELIIKFMKEAKKEIVLTH